MISNNLKDEELEQLGINDIMEEFKNVMDGLLDGGVLNVQITSGDYIAPEDKKPVIPTGIQYDKEIGIKDSPKEFYYVSCLLILLLAQLNPKNGIRDDLYSFKISIIFNAIVSGAACGEKNNNFIFSDIAFDKKYIDDNKRKLTKEEMKFVREVMSYQKAAFNFMAFSVMNFVRFNHHFMRDKVNLIQKGLMGLSENQINDVLDSRNRYKNLDFFYENFVSSVKILDDMKFYYMYVNKKINYLPKKEKSYNYYDVIGMVDVAFKDDIVNIRKECTANGFLILDITKAIIDDIISRKLAFLIPNVSAFKELLSIRNTIRENPFLYHPSNIHFNLKCDELDAIKEKFNATMSQVAGFIYCYSELMYSSVRDAKCRNKYANKITKNDEIRAKTILELSTTEIPIDENLRDRVKKEINLTSFDINQETDLLKLNSEISKMFE